ncbi:MAG: dihydrofolate reductase family protein [Sandaracinaceae bacterium]
MAGHLTYYVAASLDGRIAHLDGSFDGLLTEGAHVAVFEEEVARFDAVMMGRCTYEVGLAAGLPRGAPAYPGLENIVCTRTLSLEPHSGLSLVEDAVDAARALEAEGRNTWLCGGASLAESLFDAGLVDEVVVKLNPTLFGAGIGIVAPMRSRADLTLLSTRAFDNGVVLLRYGCDRSEKRA